jgi:hypothetical protein
MMGSMAYSDADVDGEKVEVDFCTPKHGDTQTAQPTQNAH